MDIKRLLIYPVLLLVCILIASLGFQVFGSEGLWIPMYVTYAYFIIMYLIAQIVVDNSIVDMGWGFGFVLGSLSTLLTTKNPTILSYIIVSFIAIWGIRLSYRLVRRNFGKKEDFRYAQWRKEWGNKAVIIAFFRVFFVQGVINFMVGSASYAVIKYNQFDYKDFFSIIVYVGLLIALIGLFFEIVGDYQLKKHIDKRTKTLMDKGLWSITRHPNYFGEILIWIGLYSLGFNLIFTKSLEPLFYLSLIISPLIMSLVLIKVSTPLLEKHMSKYDGWDLYTKRVPMIFPWGKKA